MSREVRRVPVDFDWPLDKVWGGYLLPEELRAEKCLPCDSRGWSPRARVLADAWYGNAEFRPEDNGSTPLRPRTPAVWAFAERNVQRSPEHYGSGVFAVWKEASRLAEMWNGMWSHHLNEDDVAALVEGNRLWDFTRTWSKEDGWKPKDPPVVPTPEEVNTWSISSLGHDTINQHIAVRARCEREGVPVECAACAGTGDSWRSEEHKAAHEAWTSTEPPEGEGWQLWETVSEGSPVSPVLDSAEALAVWMSDPERGDRWVPHESAAAFIAAGWAPSFVSTAETGLVSGVEFVGYHDDPVRNLVEQVEDTVEEEIQ